MTADQRKRDDVESIYELSSLQQGILFHSLNGGADDRYIVQVSCRISALDELRWQLAWQSVVKRHDVMRTAFAWQRVHKPMQVVLKGATATWEELDWSQTPDSKINSELDAFLEKDRKRGLDISAAPLTRLTLIRLANQDTLFVWTYHHLILDAWSASIVMSDVLQWYQDGERRDVPPRFKTYIRHRAAIARPKAEAFWTRYLHGLGPPARIQVTNVGGTAGSGTIRTATRASSGAISERITAFVRQEHCTSAHLIQAAWAMLLHRYGDVDDVVFGWVISDRPPGIQGIEQMVGLMVDTVPVRLRLDSTASARDLIRQIASISMDVWEHAHIPLPDIQRLAGIPAGTAAFDTIVIIENLPTEIAPKSRDEFRISQKRAHWRTNYSLSLMAAFENGITLQIAYDDSSYWSTTVERLLTELHELIDNIISSPAATLETVMSKSGLNSPAGFLDGPKHDVGNDRVSAVILQHARDKPTTCLVKMADGDNAGLSGTELIGTVTTLRDAMTRAGIRNGDVVAIQLKRSPAIVVAMLASMETGATFVTIDPELPALRKAFILQSSNARLHIGDDLDRVGDLPTILVDRLGNVLNATIAAGGSATPNNSNGEAAYIMYTSGSTGRPKGVRIPRRALHNILESMARRPGLNATDILLATTTISFDIALLEILLPLFKGGKLIIASERMAKDPQLLAIALERHDVSVLQATPTTWRMLVSSGWLGAPLRAWSGGEALSRELADELLARTDELWNLYGPTETTIWSMCSRVVPGKEPIDLGEPVNNTYVRLLDRRDRMAARGAIARLHIGGMGLADGYLGSVDSEAFVTDPFDATKQARLYRTGDLACIGENGRLYYLGREDAQIKLRGMRVELAEIEAVLTEHPAVAMAAVKVWQIAGLDEFVAYVLLRAPATDSEIIAAATRLLPAPLVPQRLIRMESLPTTFNGKLDRNALPPPRITARESADYSASVVEAVVLQIWREVLAIETICRDDNFFALGGHSLKVIAAIAGTNRAFGLVTPLAALFQNPTVAKFAQFLERSIVGERFVQRPPIVRTERNVPQPLSSVQRRLWYLSSIDPDGRPYLLAAAVKLSGPLDVDKLRTAFDQLQQSHGVLRTVFSEDQGVPGQIVGNQNLLELNILQPSCVANASEAWALSRVKELIERELPLLKTVPAHAWLVCWSDSEAILLLMIHHMLVDEWSLGLLVQELGRHYEGGVIAESADVERKHLDYVDYAVAEHNANASGMLSENIAYWQQRLSGAPLTTLPPRVGRPKVLAFSGGNCTASLPTALFASVCALARTRTVTPFVVLLTGFIGLVYRYLARTDICIGTMDAGRDERILDNVVGPFARPLAIRIEIDEEISFESHLSKVQTVLTEAWLHRDTPFDQIVNTIAGSRRTDLNPLFQIMIVMQNMHRSIDSFGSIRVEPIAIDMAVAEFDTMIEMFETAGSLTLRFSYNSDLYTAEEINLFAARYEELLWAVTDDPTMLIAEVDLRDEAPAAVPAS